MYGAGLGMYGARLGMYGAGVHLFMGHCRDQILLVRIDKKWNPNELILVQQLNRWHIR